MDAKTQFCVLNQRAERVGVGYEGAPEGAPRSPEFQIKWFPTLAFGEQPPL